MPLFSGGGGDLHEVEGLEDAVRQGRGSGATAREGQDEKRVPGTAAVREFDPVGLQAVDLFHAGIQGVLGRAGGKEQPGQEHQGDRPVRIPAIAGSVLHGGPLERSNSSISRWLHGFYHTFVRNGKIAASDVGRSPGARNPKRIPGGYVIYEIGSWSGFQAILPAEFR